jgi:hypothetical protein
MRVPPCRRPPSPAEGRRARPEVPIFPFPLSSENGRIRSTLDAPFLRPRFDGKARVVLDMYQLSGRLE